MRAFWRTPRVSGLVMTACVLAALPTRASGQEAPKPKAQPTAVVVQGPDVGQRAPQFALQWATKDTIGPVAEPFRLADNLGKVVVLAFYPRDFTRGCTAQFQEFAERHDELFGADVVVVGVSADSLPSHQRFARSLNLPFMLLSDPDQSVSRKYGSAGAGGLNRRTVYVLRPDGKVAWRNMEFIAVDPKAYQELGRAVAEARR